MKLNLYLSFLFLLCLGVVNAQFTEDFESGLPAGWSADGGWEHGTAVSVSSDYFGPPAHTQFMAVNDDAAGNGVNTSGRVTTAEVDLSAVTSPFLRLQVYFINGDYLGDDERATVQVSRDGGATWIEVFDFPGAGEWVEYFVSLTQFAGETVLIAFEYNDGGGWNYGFCIDDIELVNYEVKSNAEFLFVTTDCSAAVPGVVTPLSGAMFNYATDTVTSFDVHITGDGIDEMLSITDVVVPPFTGINFDLGYDFTVGAEDALLTCTIVNLSTGDDEDTADNAIDFELNSVNVKPGQHSVVEEATGSWCTWCPRGHVFMERASHCFGDAFVGIAVHNNDPMAFAEYDNGVTSFPGFTGFPSVLVDRQQVIDPADIFEPIANKLEQDPTIEIGANIMFDEGSREILIEASAKFNFDAVSGYRFLAVVVEDGVTGATSGYDQVNAYAGGAFGPMGGYENLPNPVPAAMMVYDKVGRALLPGFDGAPSSISTVSNGETVTWTFDPYTLPASYNSDETSIVVMVLNPQGRIVNANQFDLGETSSTFFVNGSEVNWNVSPNPFSTHATLTVDLPQSGDVNITMIDMLGRVVWSRDYADQYGVNNYSLVRNDMAAGIYNVLLTYEGQTAVQKVIVD